MASEELYRSERITVKVAANSAAKVMITDNFTGSNVTLNREAFIEMCREMGKEEQAKAVESKMSDPIEPKETPKTGADIVNDALAGAEGTGSPEPETVGRVDAPDSETAEGVDGDSSDA